MYVMDCDDDVSYFGSRIQKTCPGFPTAVLRGSSKELPCRTMVIGVRGTADVDTAKADLQQVPMHLTRRDKRNTRPLRKMHKGFYKHFDIIESQLTAKIKELLDSVPEGTRARLLLTGHSLGGSSAILANFN